MWILVSLAALSWTVGQTLFASYPLLNNGAETPFPSIADVFYLIAPLLIALALLLYKRGLGLQSSTTGSAVAVSSFLAALALGLNWNWAGITSGETAKVLTQSGYALFQPLMIGALVWVASCFRGGRIASSYAWMLVGLLAYYFADQIYAYMTNQGTYATGSLIDVGWIAGWGLIAYSSHRVLRTTRGELD
jgi:diguanylate cyclase